MIHRKLSKNTLIRSLTLKIDGRREDGGSMPVNFLGPGGHYGTRGRVGPVVRVGVGMRGMMGRKRCAASRGRGTSGGGGCGRVTGIAGGPCRGIAISRLAHLRAGAQVAVAALHLAGGQGTAGRLEAGRGRGRGLVQIRIVHHAGCERIPLDVTPILGNSFRLSDFFSLLLSRLMVK